MLGPKFAYFLINYLSSKVTKVARTLAAKSGEAGTDQKPCTVMALLDGGTLRRHKSWLKVTFVNME